MKRRALIGLAGAVSALATATVVAGGAAAAQPPASGPVVSGPIVSDPFAADSDDACTLGATKGTLGWHLGQRQVDVRGAVVDRGPGLPCGNDGRYTTATFTAYAGDVPAGTPVVRKVDNGQLSFTFPITSARAISTVVVQVCRHSRLPGPADYCGTPDVNRAPLTTETGEVR
jgi:hypothetical protein